MENNPNHKLIDQLSIFIQQELLSKRSQETQLEWWYIIKQLPGTIQDKLDWLLIQPIPSRKLSTLMDLQQQPDSPCFKDPHLTSYFNQSFNQHIITIQNQIPTLKNYTTQQTLIEEQKRLPVNNYTFQYDYPKRKEEKATFSKHLNKLYKLVHTQYYLEKHQITDHYCGFDPLIYTVIESELAQKLHLYTHIQAVENLYNLQYSLTYRGIKPILDQLDTIFTQLQNAKLHTTQQLNIALDPYEYFPRFGKQLAALQLPPTYYNKITNQFIQAIHGLESHFTTGNAEELPYQHETAETSLYHL
ncbi:hypothetical protein DBR11_20910 [Pedobacter sp. HMWF019]|uniref:hypothetical protein n=1 Tax=Pedobacter sp. HMWF019 TaxID=2056856 RepID=UPI000D38C2AD|nr:hypothetical protein [Pedobacter sp. HMWF019]PTS95642.1 hypothetical protein DBR11_20910 [Pedobacter sp. HMWF019]